MKFPIVFFLILPIIATYELDIYERLRNLTSPEYQDQFQFIIDDLSVSEEETNRKLIELATSFDQQNLFRRELVANKILRNMLYADFLSATQRIKEAKRQAQAILANRNRTAEEQYQAAVKLDKHFPMEMSVLLDICKGMGYKNAKEVIASSLKDIPKTVQLAKDLQKYADEAQENGYAIAQALNDLPFVSRKSRLDARKDFLNNTPKAMVVHDFVVRAVMEGLNSILINE
ncbi:hypothetical protein GCK72_013415 [Caenorhabditis remanei]|uniref:Uncharacterized protein n=1 Tax=Caenorhabditis remanei TaxID=31234 RepID=A0A6A5GNQ9_CAERE|nr:hypothetical protein GCK72_013415 [Caenorhabditis remanei]KAF1756960.1 hypothetical protein GCK72_013415 [Caenorhabditis remanei]